MIQDTRYVFFGTPDFAAVILEKLIKAGFPPAAVVCNPDRPVGRKKIITPPPVKLCVRRQASGVKDKIKILQPEKLEIGNWKLEIDKLGGVDFAIVAAYGKIIPKTILDFLPTKFIVIHPSLLPKYRGSSPIQSVILNGEKETGVTLFLADEKVDHGKIISNFKFQISNFDNYQTLNRKLAELGADLLVETLPKFLNGEITPLLQDETQATYTKKFITEDGYVESEDLEKAQKEGGEIAIKIDRKIRALNPEPGVYVIQDGKRMKILEAELTPENKLKLKKIQFEGKKPRMLL